MNFLNNKFIYLFFKSNEQFLNAVESLKYVEPASSNNGVFRLPAGSTLDEELESLALKALNKRRKNHSLVILLFDDGTSIFATSAYTQGKFANFLEKRQYISFYIISHKADRFLFFMKIKIL